MPKSRPLEAKATPPRSIRRPLPPREAPRAPGEFPVVGIGASAGGLEASKALVDALRRNVGILHEEADSASLAQDFREQGGLYLTTGTKLISSEGNVLAKIVADTCGRHDSNAHPHADS